MALPGKEVNHERQRKPHGEQRDKREPGRAKRRRVEQMHGQRRVEHDFETDQNAKGNGKHEPG